MVDTLVMAFIFVVIAFLGYEIGYCTARIRLEKEVNGSLHIVNEEGEDPYIFLELKDTHARAVIEESKYVILEVTRK